MSVPTPLSCPGSSMADPHKYNLVPGKGDEFVCDRCKRTVKYDSVSRSFKVIYSGMTPK
jgi:hypothetical protein